MYLLPEKHYVKPATYMNYNNEEGTILLLKSIQFLLNISNCFLLFSMVSEHPFHDLLY